MKKPTLTTHWPIDELRKQDLYFYQEVIESYPSSSRVLVRGHGEMLMLGGYSYLGLNGHPKINRAAQEAIEHYGTGTHGVRMLAGTLDVHKRLEARIAKFKQTEAVATFSSGFFANVSTIACLLRRCDTVICDKLNHASIIDGCRLAEADFVRFRHNDMQDLEECLSQSKCSGMRLVVVDAVFSMDGDIIDLPTVSRLCKQYGAWLMVDEAHSVGVLGRTGHGIEEHFQLPPDTIDIKTGTLSKAIPSAGGYVACSHAMWEFLCHQARGYIYSASLPPPAAAAATAAFDVIEEEPERVTRLHDLTTFFASRLNEIGFSCLSSTTAILPIICGEDHQAWKLARFCQKRGIYVQAIPHGVVPKGTARLRTAVTASHTREDLEYCVGVLEEGAKAIGGILS
jgi:glycine C-acetyltransferase